MLERATNLFLDANIFFAAVASSKGGSYLIIELAKKGLLLVSSSAHALSEAEHNILKKLGSEALACHRANLLDMRLHMQSISRAGEYVTGMSLQYLPDKDVPILIAAMESGATHLITLDRKHFLDNQNIKDVLAEYMKIVTPGDFLKECRSFLLHG